MSLNMTEVRLLRVPLESDYKQTLYFETKSAQEQYFKSKTMKTGVEFTYQRKDRKIRWHEDYDSVIGCNYVMYKNASHSDKWYYAFITNIEYISDGRCDISIETDVIQTWFFDYVVQPSFVEREHTDIDHIGYNTQPEGLELGEYVTTLAVKNPDLLNRTLILACTVNLNSDSYGGVAGNSYGGVYSGVRYYHVSTSEANEIISKLAEAGKVDSITAIFEAPSSLVESGGSGYKALVYSEKPKALEWTPFNKPTTLQGYKPRNNKLFTYPYCYLLMSNNSGGSAVYHYELMGGGDTCEFKIHGVATPGYSIRLVPDYYKGVNENNLEGLNMGKFPVCSWATDVYTNWLTQNSANIQVGLERANANMVLSGVGGVASAVTGNFGGAVNGVSGMANSYYDAKSILAQKEMHSFQPPQAEGNLNSGDVTYAMGELTYTAYQMSIKSEFAQIIDKYFDMYGYQTNYVHTPLKNHRKNYWYTKTVDVNIDGLVPMEDMARIKACYNNGITFWKNPSNIGNYSVSNEII